MTLSGRKLLGPKQFQKKTSYLAGVLGIGRRTRISPRHAGVGGQDFQ